MKKRYSHPQINSNPQIFSSEFETLARGKVEEGGLNIRSRNLISNETGRIQEEKEISLAYSRNIYLAGFHKKSKV